MSPERANLFNGSVSGGGLEYFPTIPNPVGKFRGHDGWHRQPVLLVARTQSVHVQTVCAGLHHSGQGVSRIHRPAEGARRPERTKSKYQPGGAMRGSGGASASTEPAVLPVMRHSTARWVMLNPWVMAPGRIRMTSTMSLPCGVSTVKGCP